MVHKPFTGEQVRKRKEMEKQIRESYDIKELGIKQQTAGKFFAKHKVMDNEELREDLCKMSYDVVALCKVFSLALSVGKFIVSRCDGTLKAKMTKHIDCFDFLDELDMYISQYNEMSFNRSYVVYNLNKYLKEHKDVMKLFNWFIFEGTRPLTKKALSGDEDEDEDEDEI